MLQQDLAKYLRYDPESGDFFWKVSRGRSKAGTVAGATHRQGYTIISLSGRLYYAHRLVFFIEDGVFPEEVDHINGDTSDNRRSNLRKTTRAGNRQNTKVSKRNKLGVKNVSLTSSGKYLVCISECGISKRYGPYSSLEEAKQKAEKERKRINGEFSKG